MKKISNLSHTNLREKADINILQNSKTADELVKNLEITEEWLTSLSEKEKSKILRHIDDIISSKKHFYENSDLPSKTEMLWALVILEKESEKIKSIKWPMIEVEQKPEKNFSSHEEEKTAQEKTTEEVSKNTEKIKIEFATFPNIDGEFELTTDSQDTLYQFTILSDDTGIFEFTGNDNLDIVVSSYDKYIDPACKYTGDIQTTTSPLRTVKKGKVMKAGDKWKVIEKAELEFDSPATSRDKSQNQEEKQSSAIEIGKNKSEKIKNSEDEEKDNNEKILLAMNKINELVEDFSSEEINKDRISIKHKNQIIKIIEWVFGEEQKKETIPVSLKKILSIAIEKWWENNKNILLSTFKDNIKKIEKNLSSHRLWEKIAVLEGTLSDEWYKKKFQEYMSLENYEEALKIVSHQRWNYIEPETRKNLKTEMENLPDSSFKKNFNTIIKWKEKILPIDEEKQKKIREFAENKERMKRELNYTRSFDSIISRIIYGFGGDEIFSANEKENEYKKIINLIKTMNNKEKINTANSGLLIEKLETIYKNRKKSLPSSEK